MLQVNNRLADWIWQSASVTIVAQAGTLPLTITLFNRFPTYFILTNVIIVPFSSLIIIAGCLIPLTYPVPALSGFFASSLNFLTGLTELLTKKAASLPYSAIDNIGMTGPECFLLSAAISVSFYFLLKKDKIALQYPLLTLFLFVLAGTIKDVSVRTTKEIIVYNTIRHPCVGIRTGGVLNVYFTGGTLPPEILKHSSTLGLEIDADTLPAGNGNFIAGNRKISILNAGENSFITIISPKDLMFQRQDNLPYEKSQNENPPLIHIVALNSREVKDLRHSLPDDHTIKVHVIKKSGAYRMSL
jgi:hypothetical protein